MARRATTADLLSKKKAVTRTVEIVLDGGIADEWAKLRAAADAAQAKADASGSEGDRRAALDAADAVDAYRQTAEDATVEVVVQSLGRRAFEELIEAHPPTDKQKREARKTDPKAEPRFNADTFIPALLSASMIEPKMTEDEVAEMMESEQFNVAELGTLAGTALFVNETSKVVDLGKG